MWYLSLSLVESCLIIPRECNQRGTFDAHIESTNKSCLDRWQPSQRYQAMSERRTGSIVHRVCGAAALGNTILTCCSVSDNKNLHMRECHCKRRCQYTHNESREQRDTNNTTRAAAAAARARGATTQSIDRSRDQPQHPTNQPTNQSTNQPTTQPIMILDVSLGSMAHSIEIELIRS